MKPKELISPKPECMIMLERNEMFLDLKLYNIITTNLTKFILKV